MKCECTIDRLRQFGVEWRKFDNFCGPERDGWSMFVGAVPDSSFTNISRCPLCGEDIDAKPRSRWYDNSIQFPRLLAEIWAVIDIADQLDALVTGTDSLKKKEVVELFERASKEWERIKDETIQE